ncbi:30S ribosomal protein S8 [Patescibacteria group bacterium]|nr:30S ribosomal protein S8 [Patescibacteria group bacterium]
MNIDPIADILLRIRNAHLVGKTVVVLPTSKIKEAIANILVAEGYLNTSAVEEVEGKKRPQLVLSLKYYNEQPVIHGFKQISTPGHRIYRSINQLTKRPISRIEDVIISTSKGLMTLEAAQKAQLGGEVLFKVW